NTAMIRLMAVAIRHTMRLFRKYCASGTVYQMSMYGWNVMVFGHHVKLSSTSPSGLTDEVIITHSGKTVKAVRITMVAMRNTRAPVVSRTLGPPIHEQQIDDRHDQQEDQQQHRHRRAVAEVE